MEKRETTEAWLKKGNRIKVLPPYKPKITTYFGKTSSKTKSSRNRKGGNK